jgi:hypothetical protein
LAAGALPVAGAVLLPHAPQANIINKHTAQTLFRISLILTLIRVGILALLNIRAGPDNVNLRAHSGAFLHSLNLP